MNMAENKNIEHENPPLGELKLPFHGDDGVKHIPALDKRWAPRSIFSHYISLMASGGCIKTGAKLEEWQYQAQCFLEDVEYLLDRKHHEFWSYMVHQKAALSAILSFLQRATPFYLDIWAQSPKPDILQLYEKILAAILRIICRLITIKESEKAWLTKEHIRQLIYMNFLISVPMLLDLAIAIGNADIQNVAVLQKIFTAVLQIEPKYKQDLTVALAFFKTAFRSIQTQTENEGFEGAGGGVLDENVDTPYDDVALYTLDCSYSLSVLLEVCPEACHISGKINLGQSIAQFYDTTIPFLYKHIFVVNESAISLGWLNQSRLQYLKAFHAIACAYINLVLSQPENNVMLAEQYIALLMDGLSEQTFVIDYESQYPVELDLEIVKEACKEFDDFKASFVIDGYQRGAESAAKGTIGQIALIVQAATKNPKSNQHNEQLCAEAKKLAAQKHVNDDFVAPAGRDIDLEVTAVLDVLPDLGTGFVRRVLARYDRSEDAIAAILEENLPPDLLTANKTEEYIPPDPQDKLYHQTGVRHFNVYDGDAYDVLTQDQPQCIVKQGKGFPGNPQTADQLLDDKRDLQAIKHRFLEYSLVAEKSSDNNEYQDEYDDSYDALLESETLMRKSKDLKGGLASVLDDGSAGDSEDGTDFDDERTSPIMQQGGLANGMNFCENPEDVRARYEAKRQAKWSTRTNSNTGTNASRNVVGAPKGQGQDKETLKNRNKKEINKSSRANHNRKSGAAYKRSKGMIA